jgi:hypothetical protein
MRHRPLLSALSILSAGLALVAAPPVAAETVNILLRGFEEVPANTTAASGSLRLFINDHDGTIDYELSFENLTGAVTQAHIHVGQAGVNGGVAIFLCGTAGNPGPAGTPPCPTPGGTVTGTLTATQVIGPTAQLVAPGELDEVIRAIRAGVAYGNVHSSVLPAGEIRGQLH